MHARCLFPGGAQTSSQLKHCYCKAFSLFFLTVTSYFLSIKLYYRYYSTYMRSFLVNYFSTRPLMLLSPQATQASSRLVPGVVIVGRGAMNFIYRCKYIISFLSLLLLILS